MFAGQRRAERDEVRNDRQQIDQVHHVLEESEMVRRRSKPRQELKRKPDDTDCLNDDDALAALHAAVVAYVIGI